MSVATTKRRGGERALLLVAAGLLCLAAAWAAVADETSDLEAGRRAYQRCSVCHLPDAAGRTDGTFPSLAGQHRSVIVKQLVDIREGQRSNPIMQPHAQALVDAREIDDVAAYLASLPLPAEPGRGEADDLERGTQLYARDCVACHGARGDGDAARTIPVLGGQHYAYLLRQIRAIAGGRRGNSHPEMQSRIRDYTDAELRAVVDYASRLPGRGPAALGASQNAPIAPN